MQKFYLDNTSDYTEPSCIKDALKSLDLCYEAASYKPFIDLYGNTYILPRTEEAKAWPIALYKFFNSGERRSFTDFIQLIHTQLASGCTSHYTIPAINKLSRKENENSRKADQWVSRMNELLDLKDLSAINDHISLLDFRLYYHSEISCLEKLRATVWTEPAISQKLEENQRQQENKQAEWVVMAKNAIESDDLTQFLQLIDTMPCLSGYYEICQLIREKVELMQSAVKERTEQLTAQQKQKEECYAEIDRALQAGKDGIPHLRDIILKNIKSIDLTPYLGNFLIDELVDLLPFIFDTMYPTKADIVNQKSVTKKEAGGSIPYKSVLYLIVNHSAKQVAVWFLNYLGPHASDALKKLSNERFTNLLVMLDEDYLRHLMHTYPDAFIHTSIPEILLLGEEPIDFFSKSLQTLPHTLMKELVMLHKYKMKELNKGYPESPYFWDVMLYDEETARWE